MHSNSSRPRTPKAPPGPHALSLVDLVERQSVAHSLVAKPARMSYEHRPEPSYPDPIELNILSHVECEMLFERFHTVLAS